jgi:hypothetical protein
MIHNHYKSRLRTAQDQQEQAETQGKAGQLSLSYRSPFTSMHALFEEHKSSQTSLYGSGAFDGSPRKFGEDPKPLANLSDAETLQLVVLVLKPLG